MDFVEVSFNVITGLNLFREEAITVTFWQALNYQLSFPVLLLIGCLVLHNAFGLGLSMIFENRRSKFPGNRNITKM